MPDAFASLIKQRLPAEAIRFLASTQALGMVVVHAGWMLLASAIWTSGGDGGVVTDATRTLVRAYVWLGGTGPGGHGDTSHLMVVWAKVSIMFYLVATVIRTRRNPRRTIALWRLALVSGAVAVGGYTLAFWPQGLAGEELVMALVFGLFAAVATAWAVGAHRLGDALARKLVGEVPVQRAA